MNELQRAQELIIAVAQQSLRDKDDKHMAVQPPKPAAFKKGTFVLAEHRHSGLRRGPKSKMLPFLKGPMRVLNGPNAKGEYALQNLVTQRTADYHVSKLRPFLYDERTLTPLEVAVTDTPDEFIIDRVLAMKGGTHRGKKNISFKIRWAGYGPDDDTWEPWSGVRDTAAVQLYLRSHNNRRVRNLADKNFVNPVELEPELSDNEEN